MENTLTDLDLIFWIGRAWYKEEFAKKIAGVFWIIMRLGIFFRLGKFLFPIDSFYYCLSIL